MDQQVAVGLTSTRRSISTRNIFGRGALLLSLLRNMLVGVPAPNLNLSHVRKQKLSSGLCLARRECLIVTFLF